MENWKWKKKRNNVIGKIKENKRIKIWSQSTFVSSQTSCMKFDSWSLCSSYQQMAEGTGLLSTVTFPLQLEGQAATHFALNKNTQARAQRSTIPVSVSITARTS